MKTNINHLTDFTRKLPDAAMNNSSIKAKLIGGLLALVSVASAFTQEFRGLGVPWPDMRPVAMSSDGTVAVGLDGSNRLWRWTALGGLSAVGDMRVVVEDGGQEFQELLLSADGSTIAGMALFPPHFRAEAFVWNATTGVIPLGSLPDAEESGAWKISRDGTVVIGYSSPDLVGGDSRRPWRWTAQTGMQEIFIDPFNLFEFFDLSSDGNTVALQKEGFGHVWRWTTSNGLEHLGSESEILHGTALSANGRAIVGRGVINGETVVWRWTSDAFEILGSPPGLYGNAVFVSANGNAVVGTILTDESTRRIHVWRWENGTFTTLPPPTEDASLAPFLFSADASVVLGFTVLYNESAQQWQLDHSWRWSIQDGMMAFTPLPESSDATPTAISADGSLVIGFERPVPFSGRSYPWLWTQDRGKRTVQDDFSIAGSWQGDHRYTAVSDDGSTVLGVGTNPEGNVEPWIARYRPAILQLGPSFAAANSPGFMLEVAGAGVAAGSKVHWNGMELNTSEDLSGFNSDQLFATVPASLLESANPTDLATVRITIVGPTGVTSAPKNFVIMGDETLQENIHAINSVVVTPGSVETVSIVPDSQSSSGISATLTVNGSEPASVTLATYGGDPSGSANTSFEVAGQFMDVNVSGVTEADSMTVYFYFPAGTDPQNLALKFWNVDSTPAAWENVTPTIIDAELNRIEVTFNATSHPKITELDGTFFAAAHEFPIQFTGFLAPIGGADATGGSFAAPVRTFKSGSTIPVKFSATAGGAPVTTGIHRLQAIKYSDTTTGGTPIDATPQEAATTGNQFRLSGQEWHFNLDTKSTGVTTGIWQLVAILSDGSEHVVWVQMK